MKLRLIRHAPSGLATIGRLWLDGTAQCWTLEDEDRHLETGGTKLPGQTAIPLGTYQVVIDHSPKFKRDMLHVLGVPQFEGVRIHAGNGVADTDGCILVGAGIRNGVMVRSRVALLALESKVRGALADSETVMLTIERSKT